jgi:hypothetical protein
MLHVLCNAAMLRLPNSLTKSIPTACGDVLRVERVLAH